MRAIFKITEPSGKIYRIFADGHAEGFEPGAVVCNYIPAVLALVEVTASMSDKPERIFCAASRVGKSYETCFVSRRSVPIRISIAADHA